jgi:hypothetical protein
VSGVRTCSKCLAALPEEAFAKGKARARCKARIAAQVREGRKNNPEKARLHYHKNREKCIAKVRRWQAANRDKYLEYLRQWRKANPDYVRPSRSKE